jgi:hypothetical protein
VEILSIVHLMTKIVMILPIIMLIPKVVQIFMRFVIAHFFSCSVNLSLEFQKMKHLLSPLLHLLMNGFKDVDFFIKLLFTRGRVDGLLLMVPCLSDESFVPLIGIDWCKGGAGCRCFLWWHGVC